MLKFLKDFRFLISMILLFHYMFVQYSKNYLKSLKSFLTKQPIMYNIGSSLCYITLFKFT